MKTFKKATLFVLAVMVAVLGIGLQSFSENGETDDGWLYEVVENEVTIVRYNGGGGDVEVPSEIEGKPVKVIGDGAFAGNPDVVSVTVPEGVVAVGEEAFADCPNLESVELPESVTSMGRRTFRYSQKLSSVVLPSSLSEFPYQGFWDCQYIDDIVIPEGIVTVPNGAFYNCYRLKNVTVPDSVTTIEKNAFHACLRLENIDLSANVTTINESAFSDCEYLVINAPEGSVAAEFAVQYGYVPENCILESDHPYLEDGYWEYTYNGDAAALKVTFSPKCYFMGELGLDEFYVTDEEGNEFVFTGDELAGKTLVLCGTYFELMLSSYWSENDFGFRITDIQPMTEQEYEDYLAALDADPWEARIVNGTIEITGYRGLRSDIVIPAEINEISVASIGENAFEDNRIIKNVVISEGIKEIGANAFYKCKNLEHVSVPESVSEIGESAFYGCGELKEIKIPDNITVLRDCLLYDCEALESVVLPSALEEIEGRVFSYCESLTGITLPDTVTKIGERAFYSAGLASVVIPSGVEVLDKESFAACFNLTEITLPEGLIELGQAALRSCEALTSVKLPDSLKIIGANCLAGVPVTSVTIPSGVEEIGAGAFNATALTSLFIPASVTVIGENIVINCENLADLSVAADNPNFMSKNNMIFNKEGDTLLMCSPWLEGEVVIPEGTERLGQSCCDTMKKMTRLILPTTLVELGWGSVSRCDALETVVINSEITVIPQSAFAYCTSLKEINIPDTVTEIELAAFSNCISLKNITFPKSLTTIGNGAFMYCDLEEVELPDGMESIDNYVFGYNTGLRRVTIPDSVTLMKNNVFYNSPDVTIFASAESYAFEWGTNNRVPVIAPPAAAEGLMESETPFDLVTPGTASKGKLYYALTTEESAVPENYSETIPTAKDAGTYYVWYKAVAGEKESVESVLTVTVAVDQAARDARDYSVFDTEGFSEENEWAKGGDDIVIVIKSAGADESFEHFTGVLLDANELEQGRDYTVRKSSTIVTLSRAVLETLEAGNHVVTVVFDNGTIDVPLTVRASNPPTGDGASLWMWPALAVLCAAVIFVTVVERKRRTCKG